ncbi:unnamed protein product, partial [Musa acuminata subsp. burmannicoides]
IKLYILNPTERERERERERQKLVTDSFAASKLRGRDYKHALRHLLDQTRTIQRLTSVDPRHSLSVSLGFLLLGLVALLRLHEAEAGAARALEQELHDGDAVHLRRSTHSSVLRWWNYDL